jgi:hypothetical protein
MMATARDDTRDQSALFLAGVNFGVPEAVGTSPAGLHGVRVGDHPCADVQWLGDSALRCSLTGQYIVGTYPVEVTVDGANSSVLVGAVEVAMVCPGGYYGFTGEGCRPCPTGAWCLGFGADPIALVCGCNALCILAARQAGLSDWFAFWRS